MHRRFTCFVPFHFTSVEVFTGSGHSQNAHVVYFNAKLIILCVAHWEEYLSSIYVFQNTSVCRASCFFFTEFKQYKFPK